MEEKKNLNKKLKNKDLENLIDEFNKYPDTGDQWKNNFEKKFNSFKNIIKAIFLCEDESLLEYYLLNLNFKPVLIMLNFKIFFSKIFKFD